MTYQTIDTANVTSLDGLLTYVSNQVPLFIPMMLFAIFMIITITTYFGTRRLRGDSDIWASATAGCLVSFVIGTFMTLGAGIINLPTLVSLVVFLIIGIVLLFTSRER